MFYNLLKMIYGLVPESKELIEAKNYRPKNYYPHYISNVKKKNVDDMTSNELHNEVQKIMDDYYGKD